MQAEDLIGTVLGTCTLQKLIGRGGLGAVYLAQQFRPRRQVAVKVFLPASSLDSDQLATFTERFQRETDIASALEHPNILPVHESGEQDGLAYLVMPYITGGTLRDLMQRKGALPLSTVVDYLEQLASALDYAHDRGIIHRDIKPANILLTSGGRLLLSDFGLVKIVSEGQVVQAQLTGVGSSMGTPDYMAPEQILGGKIDGSTDIYSLGVLLYQMVTGGLPFQSETPMQVVVKQLRMPPRSPRLLRADLPLAAEQVILRAMAKRSTDRYTRAVDFAAAFTLALAVSEVPLDETNTSTGAFHFSNSEFSLKQRSGTLSTLPAKSNDVLGARTTRALPKSTIPLSSPVPVAHSAYKKFSFRRENVPEIESADAAIDLRITPVPMHTQDEARASQASEMPGDLDSFAWPTEKQPVTTVVLPRETETAKGSAKLPETPVSYDPISPLPLNDTGEVLQDAGAAARTPQDSLPSITTTSGAIPTPDSGNTGSIKLSAPVKVVQLPIPGQPGRYVTGFLPVFPEAPPSRGADAFLQRSMNLLPGLIVSVFLILFGSIAFLLINTHFGKVSNHVSSNLIKPDVKATMVARATATANANVILFDPLSNNIHNWTVSTSGPKLYQFENGAYHITDNDPKEGAPAILPDETLYQHFSYTLTMEEIKGNDNSVNNAFGMIIRSNIQNSIGKMITTFYSFEVVNRKGGEYQFWKYDSSQSSTPWKQLWHHTFGNEFHQGHGPSSVNTFKINVNGGTFTLIINGKQIATVRDGSITSGGIGMLVNLMGTEVAFSNLKLAYS